MQNVIEAGVKLFTPAQVGERWSFHTESVRRKIRRGEIGSVIIGRRRLVPLAEIERIERDGFVPANGGGAN